MNQIGGLEETDKILTPQTPAGRFRWPSAITSLTTHGARASFVFDVVIARDK